MAETRGDELVAKLKAADDKFNQAGMTSLYSPSYYFMINNIQLIFKIYGHRTVNAD